MDVPPSTTERDRGPTDRGSTAACHDTPLRVHPEPYEYVDEAAVHRALTRDPAGYLRWFRSWLQAVADGHTTMELPSKQIFRDGPSEGDFRVMPCVLRSGGEVIKTVKLIGTNLAGSVVPDQVTVGKAFRLHPTDNHVERIYEACLLSSARTAACAVTAIDTLAATPPSRVGLIGCGRVAYYAALYLLASQPVNEIILQDVEPTRPPALRDWLFRQSSAPPAVHIAGPDDPIPGCDTLLVATTSTTPIVHHDQTSATLVVSVGADTHDQRELDAGWASAADLYADSADAHHVGDLAAWRREHRFEPAQATDLLTLLRCGTCYEHDRRVFISTGSALFDNITIAYLEQAACE